MSLEAFINKTTYFCAEHNEVGALWPKKKNKLINHFI